MEGASSLESDGGGTPSVERALGAACAAGLTAGRGRRCDRERQRLGHAACGAAEQALRRLEFRSQSGPGRPSRAASITVAAGARGTNRGTARGRKALAVDRRLGGEHVFETRTSVRVERASAKRRLARRKPGVRELWESMGAR